MNHLYYHDPLLKKWVSIELEAISSDGERWTAPMITEKFKEVLSNIGDVKQDIINVKIEFQKKSPMFRIRSTTSKRLLVMYQSLRLLVTPWLIKSLMNSI